MALYKRTGNGGIRRMDTDTWIPENPMLKEWNDYLTWVANGGIAAPADVREVTQEELDMIAARTYAKLNSLKAMSPEQVRAWANANITDLASLKDVVTTMLVAVSVIARKI